MVVGSALLAWAAWRAPLAAACAREPLAPYQTDAALQAEDTRPPTPFRDVRSSTRQISGTHCSGKICTSMSCGDSGRLELTFTPPEDGPEGEPLGYRVLWLRGSMPSELQKTLAATWPLLNERAIQIDLSFQGVTQLDGELALVAVDRAGNSSEPSDAVPVKFSGCMSYFDDPACEQAQGCAVVSGAGRDRAGWVGVALLAAAAASGATRRWFGRKRS